MRTIQPTSEGGVTNSADADVVPKSDGTNLVASNITDDGTQVEIEVPDGPSTYWTAGYIDHHLTEGNAVRFYDHLDNLIGYVSDGGGGEIDVFFGDFDNAANATKFRVFDLDKTITATAGTDSLAVDGTAHTIKLVSPGGTCVLGDPEGQGGDTLVTVDDDGEAITLTANPDTGEIKLNAGKHGFFSAAAVTRPEVPATPNAQDVVTALVALGLITQAAP